MGKNDSIIDFNSKKEERNGEFDMTHLKIWSKTMVELEMNSADWKVYKLSSCAVANRKVWTLEEAAEPLLRPEHCFVMVYINPTNPLPLARLSDSEDRSIRIKKVQNRWMFDIMSVLAPNRFVELITPMPTIWRSPRFQDCLAYEASWLKFTFTCDL